MLRPSYSLADGNKNLWPVELCDHACLCLCVEQTAMYQTGAETLHLHPRRHLHRPFPACRVIPAPALPSLPLHTYQPPAAVPFPESGSSSLDTADKQ